jgi:hypothetical protein
MGQHTQHILKPGAGKHDQDPIVSRAISSGTSNERVTEVAKSVKDCPEGLQHQRGRIIPCAARTPDGGSLNMVSANCVVRVNNTTYSLPRRHIAMSHQGAE